MSFRLNNIYWQNRYINNETGWDIGYISTPVKEYIDQLTDKFIKILIPGCGNGYEAEYIWNKGFTNLHLLDYAHQPINHFLIRNPLFPKNQVHCQDFFQHAGQYDLIIEQTFFCAIDPSQRYRYAEHIHSLLTDSGKLTGLLFDCEFEKQGPPFGGNKEEYKNYFLPYFNFLVFETCYNSITARKGHELYINLQKRLLPSP